jgi:hypothetical protein
MVNQRHKGEGIMEYILIVAGVTALVTVLFLLSMSWDE